jgi:hypothetical protein
MPKKVEIGNRFNVFAVDESGDEEKDIDEVKEADGTVEITIDSGAAKSVWPKKKKGVTRRGIVGKKPRLMAANGTDIAVYGEAVLEFEGDGGGEGSMLLVDADVKKPLGAVSAMEDEGNTVCFSRKYGRFVENDETGKRIYFERKNNTYVMKAKAQKTNKKKTDGMDVYANDEADEDEEMTKEVEEGKDGAVVFRRRMLS